MQQAVILASQQKYEISKEFFNMQRHKSTFQNNKKLMLYYETLSEEFQRSYKYIFDLPNSLKKLLQQKNTTNPQLLNFKLFLKDFFDVFTIISDYQIQSYSRLRNNRFDDIDHQYDIFTFAIVNYGKVQDEYLRNRQKYIQICEEMQLKYQELKQMLTKVENNFLAKRIEEEISILSEIISKKIELSNTLITNVETINQNTKEFQQKLSTYRQKIVRNKYDYIQKITKISKNSKQSIIQIITYLNNYVANQKHMFLVKKFEQKMQFQNNSKLDLTQVIDKCTMEYDTKIENYLKILRCLETCFKDVEMEVKSIKNNHDVVIDLLKKENQYNQFDIEEIASSLDFYVLFFKNLSELAGKIAYHQSSLITLQRKVDKQKEITLSIIRYNMKSLAAADSPRNRSRNNSRHKRPQTPTNKAMLSSSQSQQHMRMPTSTISQKQKNSRVQYIQSLFDEMNEYYISLIINKVVKEFKETIGNISKSFFRAQKREKIIIDDSMEMSYMTERKYGNDRLPSKKELWLWKQESQTKIKIKPISTVKIQQFNQKIKKYLAQQKKEENQFQNLSCVLKSTKDIKGVLKLLPSSIRFSSINNKYQLFIPFDSIQKIDMDMNLINNIFTIQTIHGNLQFSDKTVGSIKKFFVSTQKAIDFYAQNKDDGNVTQRVAVVDFTDQDVKFINKRKEDIAKDLQNLNQYKHYNTIVLQNVRINDVYRVVYSDEKIVIKDKEYECFMDSLTAKFNNFNLVYKKFDQPGPSFYSRAQNVDFKNCPVYSERLIQMDHVLPKVPFFPPSCHVKQTIKIFWISHEQFQVLEQNVTSGAPYTENFYTVTLTSVHKVQNNVQLRYFYKVIQVVDFNMKGLIISKSIDELKKGNSLFCDQTKKIMMRYKIKSNRQSGRQRQLDNRSQSSIFSQKTIVKQYKSTIKNLQTKNKYLIYMLIAVFIVNVILNFII